VINIGDRRCGKAGGREDGERLALAGHNVLSVTKITVLTVCREVLMTGGHAGLVWESVL
jgi:hypothetical protein